MSVFRKTLLLTGLLIVAQAGLARASVQLGSFENPTSGQDSPIEAVIAAIEVAGGDATGLTALYKNDNPSESGFGAGSFSVDFNPDGDPETAKITQDGPVTMGDMTFTPKYVTAKMDGQNAGFSVWEWVDGIEVDWDFYQWVDADPVDGVDDNNGKAITTYTYDPGDGDVTNPWSIPDTTNGASTIVTFGISHVSVWGTKDPVDPNEPPDVVPEPMSAVVWSFLAMLGTGVSRRRR